MASVTIIVPLQFKSNSNLSITTSTPHFIITTSSSTTFKKHLHFRSKKLLVTSSPQFTKSLVTSSSKNDLVQSLDDSEGEGDVNGDGEVEIEGVEVEIEKVSRNRRRIRSKVAIEASLETVWGILTDYERLAEYIPGLVVSQVLDKQTNFARLLQIGQQNLAFGLKFNAKGVVECFEKDFEVLPYGQRRDIDFKMIEGDFDLFEGTWSIEQVSHLHVSLLSSRFHVRNFCITVMFFICLHLHTLVLILIYIPYILKLSWYNCIACQCQLFYTSSLP
ncbi:START-like domain-containing protein [Artemisia annua]|uniref:START-like domain-containing protein n=1 Tax=Artemisia annua TaxID=35608 RepID=A0A2U1NA69_ARTAN|nr:START-like domain-containing protein [Artemisia annua]